MALKNRLIHSVLVLTLPFTITHQPKAQTLLHPTETEMPGDATLCCTLQLEFLPKVFFYNWRDKVADIAVVSKNHFY